MEAATRPVRIGLIGKYVNLPDAYLSVVEALRHGGYAHGAQIDLEWIQAEEVEGLLAAGRLKDLDGIVIPGGFGERGIEGKIAAATYARENDIPCLGLCLGLQVMVIDYARNVVGLAGANSREFDAASPHPVIDLMDEQREVVDMGGTMRLGLYPARLEPGIGGGQRLPDRAGVRAPPPPLRGQPPLPGPPRERRPGVLGDLARRPAGGVHRAAGPPVLGGHPGPPGVQEPARQPPSAVRRPGRPPPCTGRTAGRPA